MLGKAFSIEVRSSNVPGAIILSAAGSLVLEHLVAFQMVWESHPEQFLILDVSKLSYIDSAAIGFLVNAYVQREQNGKKVALAGVSGLAERILNVTRVARLLEMHPTVDEAETSFKRASSAKVSVAR
jgi:anti-sigma B factor antagonist